MKLFTLPNLMTLGNLLCGCLGILSVFEGNIATAAILIGIALVLDFGDGFVARVLNMASPIGKELDSLADVVTFGVLPSFILFNELLNSGSGLSWLPYIAFLIALFSALRLAKFNVDTRQSDSFIGVPTPANAMVVGSLPLIEYFQPQFTDVVSNTWVLVAYILIMSFLLISEIPLFALKFKNFSWQSNRYVYIFLLISVALLAIFQFLAVPMIITLYVLMSVLKPKNA